MMPDSIIASASVDAGPSASTRLDEAVQAIEMDELRDVDLETILSAWQTATDRLQQTHELLRTEISRLSDELEAKNVELARQNRLADIGRMASHVAHEVRNSLMPLTLYLSLLQRQVQDEPKTRKLVEQIQSGFVGLETTVSDLLSFTTDRDPKREQVALRTLIEELVESLAPQLRSQGIEVDIQVVGEETIFADLNMLRRALLNLILNAIDVMKEGGELTLRSETQGNDCLIQVLDRGTGIPQDVLDRVCDPFFTTKSEGTGLGLAIVERTATAHQGEVLIANREDGGASITLRIPRVDSVANHNQATSKEPS